MQPFPTCRAHREDGLPILPSVHTREKWQAIFRCADKSGRFRQQRTPEGRTYANLRFACFRCAGPGNSCEGQTCTFLAEKQLSARFETMGHEPQKISQRPEQNRKRAHPEKQVSPPDFFGQVKQRCTVMLPNSLPFGHVQFTHQTSWALVFCTANSSSVTSSTAKSFFCRATNATAERRETLQQIRGKESRFAPFRPTFCRFRSRARCQTVSGHPCGRACACSWSSHAQGPTSTRKQPRNHRFARSARVHHWDAVAQP